MTPMSKLSFVFVALTCLVNKYNVEGSNILFFHTVGTSSHRTSIYPLAEKLAEKGHNVTYIFASPKSKLVGSHPRIEEIAPSLMVPILEHYVLDFDINFRLNNTIDQWLFQIFHKCLELCEAFYDSPETKEWLSRPGLSYDLLLIDQSFGECAYGLVDKFKAKHILFVPVIPMFMWDGFGLVPETASIPEAYFHVKPDEMNFLGRLKSTTSILIWRLAFVDYMRKVWHIVSSKLNNPELPAMQEFEKNTSLVMINHHFVEEYPLALPPFFATYSGLWCSKDKLRTIKPLPEKLETFIKGSDGFIYVSFGGAVVASGMPDELRNVFFNAFAAFPNIKFFWRWTGEHPKNTPKNVMLMPWFPQRDVLAHPKIKGFIFQGGRPSTQEALCFGGIPMITFPVFADQDYNADRLKYIGASISLDFNTVTENSLRESIKEILTNSTYKETTVKLSKIFRDRPLDPLEHALYNTEYVLRHDTKLMKPLGMEKTWWQRRLLDVYAALIIIVAAIVGILLTLTFCILKCIGKLLCKSKVKTE